MPDPSSRGGRRGYMGHSVETASHQLLVKRLPGLGGGAEREECRKCIPSSMLWYIAVGSAIGGVSRYLIGGLVQRLTAGTFPAGTLLINITGSFLLGAIVRYGIDTPTLSPEVRAFLTVGLCGGYTTFSSFSYETVALMEDGEWSRAVLYVALSIGFSVLAALLGLVAARELIAVRTGV